MSYKPSGIIDIIKIDYFICNFFTIPLIEWMNKIERFKTLSSANNRKPTNSILGQV